MKAILGWDPDKIAHDREGSKLRYLLVSTLFPLQ